MFKSVIRLVCLLAILGCPQQVLAQINGFTQPVRQVDLASDETGAIAELLVEEGALVTKDQALARLDDRVQKLQVESARHLTDSDSALEAARLNLEKRQLISKRIRELMETGNATESEIIRSDLEFSIAHAKYMAAQEESVGRDIDLRRAELLLERRTIRAPFDGVVSVIHRREGEFLSPVRPELATLVDISQLLAVFNVPSIDLPSIQSREQLTVIMSDDTRVAGTLHNVGVQTDAESGTVQVKVLLNNGDRKLRSGEQCYLQF
jgi:RND family efflux transporter MFP subunit